ncbi:MAG: ferritin-like domain-containing protein [Solirubrobacterales bacterium]|nr:ferritin-like domain-containing protein [Solirubrobacterales bacterium]
MTTDPRGDSSALSSRRVWLTGGAAAGAAALLSACSGGKPLREKVQGGGKVTPADVPPLNGLLDVEHYAIAAYASGIPLLPQHTPQAYAAIQFLAQELAHAVQLSDLIHRAKGKPRRPAASYDLGHPQTPADVAALLKQVEETQISAYLNTIPRLSGGARSAAAAILANDAQHLAVLRWQTGESPTPSALVKGS